MIRKQVTGFLEGSLSSQQVVPADREAFRQPEPTPVQQLRPLIPDHCTPRWVTKTDLAADQIQEIDEKADENLSFLAASPVMLKVQARVESLAKVDAPILIVGEIGSGKDAVARLIHKLSNRSGHRFLKVSCATLDSDLVERELFEQERNSWCERPEGETWPFVLCKKGTLLLEDIEELPTRAQAKLLCLLQDKHTFLGGKNLRDFDVRILASTKLDLRTALVQRKLRRELYYSLSSFTITVPPLRQRTADIPLLLEHFMNRIAIDYGLPTRRFSPAVVHACQSYSWPGNLRELETFVKRYIVSGEGGPLWRAEEGAHSQKTWLPAEMTRVDSELVGSVSEVSPSKSLLHSVREEAERNAITTALEQTRWNRTVAARLLKVSYRTLLYKIQQYDLSPRKL
jgi:DNA-binding NtrC family response regulator